jgi:hypothetical protein
MSRERGDHASTERAVSTVLSFILIVSMVVTVSVGILLVGMDGVDRAQANAETSSVEYTMSELNSQASLVALDSNNRTRTVDLGAAAQGNAEVVDDGRITVEVDYASGSSRTVMDEQMGSIKYTNPQTGNVVAFQGGGVWKQTDSGSSMVSPPEFHYRDSTLTLPAMTIDTSASSVTGQYVTVKRTDTETMYPLPSDKNPIEDGEITITIESEYYEAWGTFFEERTESDVTYDHANERVQVTLITELETETLSAGVAATAETFVIKNPHVTTGSYDSRVGPSTATSEGDLRAQGDIVIDANAEVDGDLIAGGEVRFKPGHSNAEVRGNISHTDGCSHNHYGSCDPAATGWVAGNASVDTSNSISGIVDNKMEDISENGDEVDLSAESSLDNGTYYVTDGDLSSNSLDLNTSDGDIVIGIKGDFTWENSDISVTDPDQGSVRIYTNASSVEVTDTTVGDTVDRKSASFWIYGKQGLDATIKGGTTEFVGVLYAPSDVQGPGYGVVEITDHATVYGGIAAGGESVDLDVQANVYRDKALESTNPLEQTTTSSYVTFIHVTKNEIAVTED